jgi:hypothetical protein
MMVDGSTVGRIDFHSTINHQQFQDSVSNLKSFFSSLDD